MHSLIVVLGLALLGAGCGEGSPPPPSEIEGVIQDVGTDGDRIAAFVLQAGDEQHEILLDPEHDYGFDLTHLYEHQQTGEPVVVILDPRPDGLYALRIDDADMPLS